MRLARTSVVYFLSDVVISVVGFLATLYFARVLGADALGQYFLVVALVAWLSIPSQGVGEAISKRLSEEVEPGHLLSAGFLVNAILAGTLAVLVLLARARIDAYVGTEVAALFAGLLVAKIAFDSVLSALSGQHKVARMGLLKTAERLLRVALQVGLVVAGYTVAGLVGGEVLAVAVASIGGLFLFGIQFGWPTVRHVREIVSYARYAWLSNLKARSFAWMDTVVLSLFVGTGIIAAYEVSWRLASILVLVSKAVHQTLFPEMSKIATEGDREELLHLLDEGLFAAGLFVIPGLVGALILGRKLLRIYGPEFTQGALVLPILIVALGLDAYGAQFETLVNAFDRPDLMFRVNLLFVTTNLVLNLVLVWQFGFVGAAFATAVSTAFVPVFGYYFTVTHVGSPHLPLVDVGHQVLAGVVMGGAVLGLRRVLPWANMYVTVGLVFVGGGLYFLILLGVSRRFRQKATGLVPARWAGG